MRLAAQNLVSGAPGDDFALTGARADIMRFEEQLEVWQRAVRTPYPI